ncbi:hypothetical protein BJY01DRAFT_100466 [Aspergillus pseudoustus]|uniref:N-acetyltransferase domain-containing protein n=1 Tax=Aspergillus pseudoustus TaxID=1810923 RepID=A0ABR4KIG5_9EURO
MPFQIGPLTLADTEANFIVAEKAFHAHNRLLYTGLLSPSSRAIVVKEREESWPGPDNVKNFKVVNDAGELIASSRWAIHEEDEEITQSVEEAVEARLKQDLPELRKDVARALYTLFAAGKREIIGIRSSESGEITKLQRRVELIAIYVHPDYQRRGIASNLLKWGFEESERLQLPIYLEATEEGRPVYERLGFETLEAQPFDARPFGLQEKVEYAFMIRPVKTKDEDKLE